MENELKHYGVLGMKWGIRSNPSRAYKKAVKEHKRRIAKGDELKSQANTKRAQADLDDDSARRAQAKADNYYAEAQKHQSVADRHRADAKQARIDADDLDVESKAAYERGEAWLNEMNSAFKDYNISAIKKKTWLGERWVYDVTHK